MLTPLTTNFICTLRFYFVSSEVFYSARVWLIIQGGRKNPKVLDKVLRGLGVAWVGLDVSLVPSRTGQDGHSQAQHSSASRALVPWGSDFRDCSIPWSWGNPRISLPSLLLYLLGVSLLYFVPRDHFGSCLSDKPFCSEMTPLR